MFNDSGKLKNNTTIVENRNHVLDIGINNNWYLWVDTNNQLRWQYWFWAGNQSRWYWSTTSSMSNYAYDSVANKPRYSTGGYPLGLYISKGGRFDITVTKPASSSFKFTVKNLDTGATSDKTWNINAWNNNYSGKSLVIGAAGMSFDSGTIAGYPYDSNCLHTITINNSTWDGASNTLKIPVYTSCGGGRTYYHTYTNTTLHKLNVVLSDVSELGFYAKSTTGEADKLNWSGAGAYNTTTKTWTKWYAEGDTLDFPNA